MGFYVSMIFLGMILVVISLVGILYDRKRSIDYASKLEAKKNEITEVINDAEKIIEEMNKFSDYIVTTMEKKSEELNVSIENIDNKLQKIKVSDSREFSINYDADEINSKTSNIDVQLKEEQPSLDYHSNDLIIDNLTISKQKIEYSGTEHIANPNDKKVISINSKHREVISLSQNGYNDTEIAKKLHMGKGEIRLILEMNK